MTNNYNEDFLAALELAAQAAPAPEGRKNLGADDLAETIGSITDGDGAPVAGASKMRRVKGDDDWESTTVLYSTLDGRPSTVLKGMVPKKLAQRWPEGLPNVPEILVGKPVFTRKPLIEYKQGTNVCFLNVNHPERDFIVEIGLGGITCRKSNLPTEFAARQHGEHKHSDEWKAYQEAIFVKTQKTAEYRSVEQNEIMRQLLTQLVQRDEVKSEPESRERNINDGGNVNDKRGTGTSKAD